MTLWIYLHCYAFAGPTHWPRYYGVGSPVGNGGGGGGGTTAHELTEHEMQRVKEQHQKQHHNHIMHPIRTQLFHF